MKKHFDGKLLPLVILWGFVLIELEASALLNFVFKLKSIFGLLFLLACTIAFFRHRKAYRYMMFVTLILGAIGIVEFSLFSAAVAFGYDGAGSVEIQALPAFVLILFLFLHREQVQNSFFSGKAIDQNSDAYLVKVKAFKKRFEKLSDIEVERRLNEQMVPEAMEALRQLKKERQENN